MTTTTVPQARDGTTTVPLALKQKTTTVSPTTTVPGALYGQITTLQPQEDKIVCRGGPPTTWTRWSGDMDGRTTTVHDR